ncbi:MAG: hypothetical protein RR490_08895 [Niameybacter sp.]
MKQKLWKMALVVGVTIFALCLAGCGESEEQKANKLYEAKSYQEALEIYNTLENKDDEEVASRVIDCQFWLFIDYVRNNGSITIERSDHSTALPMTTKVEARESGEIKLTYIDSAFSSNVSSVTTLTLAIPHDKKEAAISGLYTMKTFGADATQTAKGVLDIGTYKMGDTIIWDDYTDTAKTANGFGGTSLGIKMLDGNKESIQKMINDLSNCMTRSGTGCKLKTIGFDKL